MRRTISGAWAVALAPLVAAGCGGGVDGGKVKGTVTLDGAPVAGAQVVFFAPTPDGRGAAVEHVTSTDEGGRFETRFADATKGLPPGEYRVGVTKLGPKKGGRPAKTDPGEVDAGQVEAGGGGANVLPAAYAKPAESPLKVTVAAGENDIPLPLKAK